ncbi:MAG: capsular biosynthesis protein, partial [Pseudomonadota bacterium]
MNDAGAGRVFLMLQGPMSFFFTYLGAALRRRGAVARRVLLCPGDGLFHRGPDAVAFRDRPRDWPAWVEAQIVNRGVTDIVCLGDGRRRHEDAIAVARALGVRVNVVEQGYLRPHFLTVEPDGTGGRSRFPRDWPAIEALAAGAPPSPRFRTSFAGYAAMDVAFNLANMLTSWVLYPHYKTHSLDTPLEEWSGWIWNKALRLGRRRRALKAAEATLAVHNGPLFVLPLQLDTDYQIRLHAPPGGVEGLLRRTLASFAAYAPESAMIVVKVHPLDHGWADWGTRTKNIAAAVG